MVMTNNRDAKVMLHPRTQRALNGMVLSGGWAYPQPSAVRMQQDALVEMGFAVVVDGVGQEIGRRFLRLTDEGRRHVTGQHAGYARSKIGQRQSGGERE